VERYATHLERVAMEVETRYCAQFQDMCSSLRLTKETAYSTFASVAQGIFSSGVNWGRVAALYAFGASLAWSMTDHGLFSLVARVADWVAQFSDQNLGEWITSRGGWEGFVKHFSGKSQEKLDEDIKGLDFLALGTLGVLTLVGVAVTLAGQ
jgi:hypothetical protein